MGWDLSAMRGIWRCMLSVVVGAFVTAALIATVAVGASRRTGHAPSQASLARSLAAGVARSRTSGARYHALLKVMGSLGIGVYTPQLKAIVLGAERSPKDFYAYDFELRNLAYALGAGQTTSLSELANELSAAGFGTPLGNGRSLAPDTLRLAIRNAARTAAKYPARPSSLAMLVVRDLGLLHNPRQDVASDVPDRGLAFDSLQSALVVADLVIPVVKRSPAHKSHRARDIAVAQSSGIRCYDQTPTGSGNAIWRGGVILLGHLPLTAQAMDFWHAKLISVALKYDTYGPGETRETAYGPIGTPGFRDPYYPGAPLKIQVRVTIAAKTWNQNDIKCGAMAGYTFPVGNVGDGVPDIPINWSPPFGPTPGYDELLKHGAISFEPTISTDGLTKTGADGVARLILKPNDEVFPGLGAIKTEDGVLQPNADLVGPFGNATAGRLANVIARFVTTDWSIQYHNQDATLIVDSAMTYTDNGFTGSMTRTVHMEIPIGPDHQGQAPTGSQSYTGHESGVIAGSCSDAQGNTHSFSYTETLDAVSTGGSTAKATLVPAPGLTPPVAVSFSPGDPTETTRVQYPASDCGPAADYTTTSFYWGVGWYFNHQNEIASYDAKGNPQAYTIANWTPGTPGSGVYATKSYPPSDGSGGSGGNGFTETTKLQILSAP